MATSATLPSAPSDAGPCFTCNVRLTSGLQAHFRSAFHTHNLRLRSVDLPAASWAEFSALAAEAAEKKAAEALAAQPCVFVCDACGKTFAAEGPFDAHCKSKRHVARIKEILAARREELAAKKAAGAAADPSAPPSDAAASAATPADAAVAGDGEEEDADEDDDDDSAIEVSVTNCLFCFADQPDVEACVPSPACPSPLYQHAPQPHAHTRYPFRSNLKHMSATHSFNVPDVEYLVDAEGLVEALLSTVISCRCLYGCSRKEFDSPQAAQQHMIDANHCRVLYDDAHVEEFEDFYDYTERDDAGAAIVRAGATSEAVILESGDLALPTGGVARPRSLMRYYKQRFRLGERPTVDDVQRFGAGALPASVRLAERGGLRPAGPAVGGGARSSKLGMRGQRREVGYWKNLYEKVRSCSTNLAAPRTVTFPPPLALQTGIRNNKIHVWERGPGGKRTALAAAFLPCTACQCIPAAACPHAPPPLPPPFPS